MDSNNGQNKDLQDKQADLLDQTYTFGWMDDYSEGCNNAIDGNRNVLNKLENESELLNEITENKDNVVNEMASNVDKALQTVERSG